MIFFKQSQHPQLRSASMMRPLSIIIAVDQRGGFCKNKKIPWHYKEDFKFFKNKTNGGICIMGRNTYQEIAEKTKILEKSNQEALLPDRESYVLSNTTDFVPVGAKLAKGLHDVCDNLKEHDTREIFVLGGESLFIEALSWTTKIYMTMIDEDYACDHFFPLQVLDTNFIITQGRKVGDLYFVEYHRK
jgi:dihydrofolate reductase